MSVEIGCLIITDTVQFECRLNRLNRKIHYHFAIFAIINEKLINKDFGFCRQHEFNANIDDTGFVTINLLPICCHIKFAYWDC